MTWQPGSQVVSSEEGMQGFDQESAVTGGERAGSEEAITCA